MAKRNWPLCHVPFTLKGTHKVINYLLKVPKMSGKIINKMSSCYLVHFFLLLVIDAKTAKMFISYYGIFSKLVSSQVFFFNS